METGNGCNDAIARTHRLFRRQPATGQGDRNSRQNSDRQPEAAFSFLGACFLFLFRHVPTLSHTLRAITV